MEDILTRILEKRKEYMLITGTFPIKIFIHKKFEEEFNKSVNAYSDRLGFTYGTIDIYTLAGMRVEFSDQMSDNTDFILTPLQRFF